MTAIPPTQMKSAKVCDSATVCEVQERKPSKDDVTANNRQLQKRRSSDAMEGRRASVVVEVRGAVRHQMIISGWYNSDTAIGLRKFLRGKAFANVMMLALFLALFMPDFWVLLQMPTNIELDCLLMIVMGLFAIEFIGLAATDPSYLFGFFFWMDLIGTVSMMFDISFMLGMDATSMEYQKGSSEDAKSNLIVVRAARAAKLGARAGRITRVLKVLRFLPFVGYDQGGDQDKKDVKMARVISNQLTNVVSTRVACLTISLVVILPLFTMFSYPEADHSMRAWSLLMDMCGKEYIDNYENSFADQKSYFVDRFVSELGRLATFYSSLSYGPFAVCLGTLENPDEPESFVCNPRYDVSTWAPIFKPPERRASHLGVPSDFFQVTYNMAEPLQREAGCQILLVIVIIMVMCLFGLMISSNVSKIALRPLERMLDTVRGIASKIFKYTAELQEEEGEEEDEEYDDIEQSTEFDLLEKVVNKLALMAELTNAKQEDLKDKEGMNEEDLGVLQFMRGADGDKGNDAQLTRKSKCALGNQSNDEPSHTITTDAMGIPQATYESWDLDILDLSKTQKVALACWITMNHKGSTSLVSDYIAEEKIAKFVTQVETQYMPNPYHNFAHGVDVVHAVARMINLVNGASFLSELDQFALIISSICHDVGHPGLNNPFLVETNHELALRYNDKSPLENMHCAKLFELMSNNDTNILSNFEKDQYKEIRKVCIEVILHTDMVQHFAMVKDLGMLFQVNSEVFEIMEPDPASRSLQEIEVLQAPDNKKLCMNCFMHSADVGNPCHPWKICSKWAMCVLDEFFAQGDQEKVLNIPVQMLNDREKVNKPNSQIGFIEFLVVPLFCSAIKLFPSLYELTDNLASNVKLWEEIWEEESKPAEEDAEKCRNRVRKMKEKCDEAKGNAGQEPTKPRPGGESTAMQPRKTMLGKLAHPTK